MFQMSEEQIKKAHEEYFGLSEVVLRSLPDSLLQPLLCRLQGERESSKILNSITERIEKERNYSRFNVAVRKFNIEQIQEAAKENDARSWLWNSDAALRDVVAREALQWRRSAMTQVYY